MNPPQQAPQDVSMFLDRIISASRLDLRFNIESRQLPEHQLIIHFQGGDLAMLTAESNHLLDAIAHLLGESCGFADTSSTACPAILLAAARANAPISLLS